MAEKFLARFGKVWANKTTGKTYGRELELKEGETIMDYKQINPKKTARDSKATTKIDSVFGNKEEK